MAPPADTPTVAVGEKPVAGTRKTVLSPPATPAPRATAMFLWQPVAAIDETFDKPSPGWPTLEDDTSRSRVEDGAYRLTVVNSPNSMVWVPRGIDVGDFEARVDAQAVGNDPNLRYGLLFRSDGGDNFYRLDYAPQLGVEVSKRVDGSDTVLLKRVADTRQRNDGGARLGVNATGSQIRVLLDDQIVARIKDEDLTRGDIALYGVSGPNGNAEFAFDNFFLQPGQSEAVSVVLTPYEDPDKQFSIHVPKDWKRSADTLGISFDAPDRLARVLVFPVDGVQPGDRPVDVARKAVIQANPMYPDFIVGAGTDHQIGDQPAYDQLLNGKALGVRRDSPSHGAQPRRAWLCHRQRGRGHFRRSTSAAVDVHRG